VTGIEGFLAEYSYSRQQNAVRVKRVEADKGNGCGPPPESTGRR
jgi:hypothetical protein